KGKNTVATMERTQDLRLPPGDDFGVLTQRVLRLLADLSAVVSHPTATVAVTDQTISRAGAHPRHSPRGRVDLVEVVCIPTKFLDAVGEDAEDLDEFLVDFRRGAIEHAQLDLAQSVVERK